MPDPAPALSAYCVPTFSSLVGTGGASAGRGVRLIVCGSFGGWGASFRLNGMRFPLAASSVVFQENLPFWLRHSHSFGSVGTDHLPQAGFGLSWVLSGMRSWLFR